MKKFKRLLTVLLCTIIVCSFFTTISAATTPKITVSNVSATPGESVKIDIEISDNPGIMSMAFCITYNSDVLEYTGYEKGYLSSYNLYNHADKGHVSFVNVESRDKSNNGVMFSVLFDVKTDAAPGNYDITLANSNREKYGTKLHNSFSTSNQEFVVPIVVSGSVTIQESCESSGHDYGEWNVISQANCTETGLKERVCTRCGASEKVEIPITHDFATDWTTDKTATFEEIGVISRHCANCSEITDEISFKLGDANSDGIVSGRDYTRILQYMNSWDVEINIHASDVNGDGKINGKDYTMIIRYLNGWQYD